MTEQQPTLAEKLAQMREKQEATKAIGIESQQAEKLEPVYAKIEEIKKGLTELEEIAKQIKEAKNNSEAANKKLAEITNKLSTFLGDPNNAEVFETLAIQNLEQLIDNTEFADFSEITTYKEELTRVKTLTNEATTLKEKLTALGVNLPEGESTYVVAEKALVEKMQSLEDELLQEEFKTPEGREGAIGTVAEKLQEKLPKTSLSQDSKSQAYNFSIGQDNEISVGNPKKTASFKPFSSADLIPADLTELEAKYGKELTRVALKKAYEEKIANSFEKFDQEHNHVFELLQDLERANPEKALAVSEALKTFEETSQAKKKLMDAKIKELEEAGIYIKNNSFSDAYKTLLGLSKYPDTIEQITEALKDRSVFPPQFDWDKLSQQIETRTKQLEAFSEAVLAIETKEDNKKFSQWNAENELSEGTIGKFFQDYLAQSDFNPSYKENEPNPRFSFTNTYRKNTLPEDFGKAKEQLETQQAELSQLSTEISRKFFLGLEAGLKRADLIQECKKEKMEHTNLDSLIRNITEDKKDAAILELEIKRLISELPEELLTLKGGEVTVVSIDEKIKALRAEKKTAETTLTKTETTLRAHNATKKPLIFGVPNWEKTKTELEKAQTDANVAVKKIADEINDLIDKSKFQISTNELSTFPKLESIIKTQNTSANSPAELFRGLEAELNKIKARKVPESVVTLHNEYNELYEKLA